MKCEVHPTKNEARRAFPGDRLNLRCATTSICHIFPTDLAMNHSAGSSSRKLPTAFDLSHSCSSPVVSKTKMASFKSKVLSILAIAMLAGVTLGFAPASYKNTVRPQSQAPLKSAVADLKGGKTDVVPNADQDTVTRPGEIENAYFQCDESVQFWRNFESRGNQGNVDRIRDLLSRNAPSTTASHNGMRAAYWSSQMLRTSYFVATAALGSIGSDLHERFIANRGDDASRMAGESFMDINGGTMTTNLLESDVPSRLVFEALKCYEQDWKFVESGLLNFPWDGIATASRDSDQIRLQLDHKQSNPLFALSETGRVIRESIGIFGRRNRFEGQPSGQVWMKQPQSNGSKSIRYPDYYLNDFHYQTDGWLSSTSANVYEASTETLFLGRQDAMQRQTLLPLLKHFESSPPMKILEVACGTGRFATFVRDNFPQADMVLSDLSPFYLEKARENDKYWRTYRGEKAVQEKMNVDGSVPSAPKPAMFVQANAESLPFPDESFDAVTCVYLFHELPLKAQANAVREMARVLKPGGMVVFTDSIQLGDRPALDKGMGNFGRLNEPHYKDFMQTPLAPLFERHGLTCSEKYVASSTKTLSFVKRGKSKEPTHDLAT